MEIPRIIRTTSFDSIDTVASVPESIDSQMSTTSTAGTTPYHSRSSSKVEVKPSDLSSSRTITNLSEALEQADIQQKKEQGTGLEVPHNATPSEMPKAHAHKRDPWTLSYPAPTGEIDVAACLARPKLAGSPFERLQAARAAMSPAASAEYDSKQEAEVDARHMALERQHYENTIRNLTRPLGYAAAFNKAEKVKRPQTFMNGLGFYEEWDTEKGGFKLIEAQTVKYARHPPPSKQVAEEEARRQADVDLMREQ